MDYGNSFRIRPHDADKTLLIIAVEYDNLAVVEALLQARADVNARGSGVDVNAKTSGSISALQLARQTQRADIVKRLLAAGAKP